MEAGYDYTLLGERPQSNAKYLPALFVAVLAGILLVSGLAYYGFASDAEAGLVTTITAPEQGTPVTSDGTGGSTIPEFKFTHRVAPASGKIIAGQQLYPAGLSDPEYWVNPLGYE